MSKFQNCNFREICQGCIKSSSSGTAHMKNLHSEGNITFYKMLLSIFHTKGLLMSIIITTYIQHKETKTESGIKYLLLLLLLLDLRLNQG